MMTKEMERNCLRGLFVSLLLLVGFMLNFTQNGAQTTAAIAQKVDSSIQHEMAALDAPYIAFMAQKEGISNE